MQPISDADRLVHLLRQKLRERAKAGASAPPKETRAPEPSGLRGLAGVEGVAEADLRRAFVQTLLAAELGAAFANDAKFQQVVARVASAIEDDPESAGLLSRLVAEIQLS